MSETKDAFAVDVQYNPWNKYFTITRKIMDTNKLKTWLNSLEH